MITGETSMTGGGAVINGADVAKDLVSARRHMGYAPQYDGLIPHLTGRDHLIMFARLRGERVVIANAHKHKHTHTHIHTLKHTHTHTPVRTNARITLT